jgi:hypothetical protein
LNGNAVCRFELMLELVEALFSPRHDDEIVAIGGQALGISSADTSRRPCDKGEWAAR